MHEIPHAADVSCTATAQRKLPSAAPARMCLAREPGVSWREIVKHRLRWIGEASESGSVEVKFTEGHTIERTGGLTCTAGSGDTYFVGSGFQMPVQGARTAEWRVRMTREDTD